MSGDRPVTKSRWLLILGAVMQMLPVPGGMADDWPFFRGPWNNGVSGESGWNSDWPAEGPKISWRTQVGKGASSFVVVGDRVITMGNEDDQDHVWCFDADSGQVLWKHSYACPFKDHNYEGGTSATPTIDGERVYTLAYDGQVFCLHLDDGRVLWQRHLVDDFGGRYSSWDYAGSPLVTGQLVVLDTGSDGKSTVALDKTSGEERWSTGADLAGYATPIPFRHDGQTGVLVFKARAMVAYGLEDGREWWRIGWRTNYDANASTPSVIGDKLFISSGYSGKRGRGALYQLTSEGPRELWVHDDVETRMNSAVPFGGYLFCMSERAGGQLMCVDLQDGSTVWNEPRFAQFGTLMVAGGRLVILDEFGELVVADAVPGGYRERARAAVLDGRCWAMPVLANGRVYARTNLGDVVCVDVRLD